MLPRGLQIYTAMIKVNNSNKAFTAFQNPVDSFRQSPQSNKSKPSYHPMGQHKAGLLQIILPNPKLLQRSPWLSSADLHLCLPSYLL